MAHHPRFWFFLDSANNQDWRACIAHAEKIGLGTSEYELIEVK